MIASLKCITVPKLELMAAIVKLKVGKIISAAMNSSGQIVWTFCGGYKATAYLLKHL